METILIDAAAMPDREAVYAYLAERLALPDGCGKNLDALYDILCERSASARLVIQNRLTLVENLGPYGEALLRALEDAAEENPTLFLEYQGE